jgi:hypothetical protein
MYNMLSNTGSVSLVLYGISILIGLFSIVVVYKLLASGKLEAERLDKFIDYFKWVVVSIVISTTTLIVSDLFKERDQDIKELEYFDKYVNDVKNQENSLVRLQLARYFSIVAPKGEMKDSWKVYFDTIKKEYEDYLLAKQELQSDTIGMKWSEKLKKVDDYSQKVALFETPLTNSENSAEWYIIAGGDATLEAANYELTKALKINGNSVIVKKDNVFRTVLMGYATMSAATEELKLVKEKINKTSYIVRKSMWCNNLEQMDKFFVCK